MNTDSFPRPPIDRDEIELAHARLRRQIRDAPPATDPLTREMQENIANGVRGRDLLSVPAYQEHLAAHTDEIVQRLRGLREELDEQKRRRPEQK